MKNKKVWWKCKKGHEWKAPLSPRFKHGCPYCVGKVSMTNSLATKFPDLAKQWHPTKNGDLTPSDVSPNSLERVWWMCDKGHEYQTVINHRTQ